MHVVSLIQKVHTINSVPCDLIQILLDILVSFFLTSECIASPFFFLSSFIDMKKTKNSLSFPCIAVRCSTPSHFICHLCNTSTFSSPSPVRGISTSARLNISRIVGTWRKLPVMNYNYIEGNKNPALCQISFSHLVCFSNHQPPLLPICSKD